MILSLSGKPPSRVPPTAFQRYAHAPRHTLAARAALRSPQRPGMSRLCVKNLPAYVDEQRLRDHFGEVGEVTDAKVIRRGDGVSRKFGFVGFFSSTAAATAQKYFHGTFLDTCKILVEEALPKNDERLRPWSKHSKKRGRSRELEVDAGNENNRGSEKHLSAKEGERDTLKAEFMQVAGGRRESKFWANDSEVRDVQKKAEESDEEYEEQQDGNIEGHEKQREDEEEEGAKIQEQQQEVGGQSGVVAGENGVGEKDDDEMEEEQTVISQEKPASALAYLKSKMGRFDSDDDEEEVDEETGIQSAVQGEKEAIEEEDIGDNCEQDGKKDEYIEEDHEEGEKNINTGTANLLAAEAGDDGYHLEERNVNDSTIADGEGVEDEGRLFLCNLPYRTSEDDLQERFSEFGKVVEVHIPVDDANRGKGFAFVTFLLPDAARAAIEATNGCVFQGRVIQVAPARARSQGVAIDPDDSRLSFKQKRELERKAKAADATGWHASHVRSDAAVAAAAKKLGVEARDLYSVEEQTAGDMAVAVALAETDIVRENREFFATKGIDVSALESKGEVKRSRTTLIIKNLPFGTDEESLRPMFEAHGTIIQFMIPRSGTLAAVEYANANEAKAALKRMAYRRFKHVPIYLEWAPKMTEVPSGDPASAPEAPTLEDPFKLHLEPESYHKKKEDTVKKLLVRNVPFQATAKDIRSLFRKAAGVGIKHVRLPKRMNGKHRGFAFVEFDTAKGAQEARKVLQNTHLYGRHLVIEAASDESADVDDMIKRTRVDYLRDGSGKRRRRD